MNAQAVHRSLAIIALFFAARIPLLLLRQPFFDELFTTWISAKDAGGIMEALRHDSGPPLYYLLVSFTGHARILSLFFSTLGLFALLREKQFAAATLLSVFPPAVLFAVDGRSYALCAMLVTLGVLAIQQDRRYTGAAWLVLAAYTHYYGILFFPLVARWKPALLYALFLPGLWMALHQPRAAIEWMHPFSYPDALFARPPLLLLLFMAFAIAFGLWSTYRASRSGLKPGASLVQWLVPSVLSIPIYVPLRFESVVATPFMQWLGTLRRWSLIAACFATWTVMGIVEHATRPPDPYAEAVARIGTRERVVASGYLYLYMALRRPVIAFPPEQAEHPGWRAFAAPGSEPPRGTFLWIGERGAPELDIIRRHRRVEPIWANAHAMIARVR